MQRQSTLISSITTFEACAGWDREATVNLH